MPAYYRPSYKDQMDPARYAGSSSSKGSSKQQSHSTSDSEKEKEKVLTYLYNDQKVYVGAAKSYQVSLPRMISTEPQGTYN